MPPLTPDRQPSSQFPELAGIRGALADIPEGHLGCGLDLGVLRSA